MLTILQISSFNQTYELFSPLNQHQQTWIVSDLKTKQDAQDYLIEKTGFCLDEAILRISEFWRLWIHRLDPKIQFVSQEFINSVVESFLLKKREELNLTPEEIKTSISYLWQMIPFLISKDHQIIIDEWIKSRTVVWQKWFLINKLSVNYLLVELKVIHTSWSSFYLSTLDLEKIKWRKEIIFDLGSEISSVEFGIIQILSKKIDITVLEPSAPFTRRFPTLLKPYEIHRGFSDRVVKSPDRPSDFLNPNQSNQFFRFHSALAEIKWMTYQVRHWLDQGVKPEMIMLSSAQIENYWPILRIHLQAEGIPFDKSVTVKFKDIKLFQVLFARLNFLSETQDWHAVELMGIYDVEFHTKIQQKFSEFKKSFFEITEFNELNLDQDLWDNWTSKRISNDPVTRDLFLKKVIFEFLAIYPDGESIADINKLFATSIKDFLSKTIPTQMSFKLWLGIFSEVVEKLDFKMNSQLQAGIKIRSLNLSFVASVTHKINFGCDQKALSQSKKMLIPIEDLKSLKKDFEFSLNESDENNYEFYLHQSLYHNYDQQITSLSKLSLTGDILETPAIILENRLKPDVDLDVDCFFDSNLKKIMINSDSNPTNDNGHPQKYFLRPENPPINSFNKNALSSSSLSSFAECPFLFFTQSGLNFRSDDVVSIDVGPQKRGQVFHALFDYLSKVNFQINPTEFDLFLADCRQQFQLYLKSELLWEAFQRRLVKSAKYFCEFEKSRGSLNFKRHSEVAFEFHFSPNRESKPVKLRGRIDRLDVNPSTGEAIVYDYKSSNNSISAPKSWLKNNEFQFFVYIMALEQDEQKKLFDITTVNNAHYYVFKDFTIKEGFKSLEEKDQFLSDFEEVLRSLLQQIETKKFDAIPSDVDHCKKCHWKETCRAPHLN
jgi:ATP-dependent helicase/nuclease subunit B